MQKCFFAVTFNFYFNILLNEFLFRELRTALNKILIALEQAGKKCV